MFGPIGRVGIRAACCSVIGMNQSPIDSALLAADILAGRKRAADALNRPEIYDHLNRSATGARLPFLGSSSKIDAGSKVGILGAVLYMQPANESGREACAGRSAGCSAACLAEGTGRMSMSRPQTARRRRHASFYADRKRFLADLSDEISAHERRADRAGKIPAIRLNGTTDLPWHRMRFTDHAGREHASLHAAHPRIRFYEYTKHAIGTLAGRKGLPSNLHITFSVSERADAESKAAEWIAAGFGAAVVTFTRKHEIPASFKLAGIERPTTDGDAHDARFLDPAGSVVILAAKGRAKTDESGFVREAS